MPLASSGALNVALHRHMGPVTILLGMTPGLDHLPVQTTSGLRSGASSSSLRGGSGVGSGGAGDVDSRSRRASLEAKHDDMESIYGLYSDLMKDAAEFTGSSSRRPSATVAATRMGWDLSTLTISDESSASDAIYQDGRLRHVLNRHVSPTDANNHASLHHAIQNHHHLHNNSSGVNHHPDSSNNHPLGVQTNNPGGDNNQQLMMVNSHHGSEKGLSPEESIVAAAGMASSSGPYGEVRGNNNSNPTYDSRSHLFRVAAAHSVPNVSLAGRHSEGVYGPSSAASDGHPINSAGVRGSASSPLVSNQIKTALLITGGNGYKRNTPENPYTSQHAHCIIWEYKL